MGLGGSPSKVCSQLLPESPQRSRSRTGSLEVHMDLDITPLAATGSSSSSAPRALRAERSPPARSAASAGAAEERRKVDALMAASAGLQAGRHYYLINRKWHVEWLQWVGDPCVQSPKLGPQRDPVMPISGSSWHKTDGFGLSHDRPRTRSHSWTKERPGPIDNEELLGTDDQLKPGLMDHSDYEILSVEVWNFLHSVYGGGPGIKRLAIDQAGSVVVELYGLTLKVYRSGEGSQTPISMNESKSATVAEFKRRACEELGLDTAGVRIWDYFNQRKYMNLESSLGKSLDDCRIYEGNAILLECQLPDGTWPPEDAPKSSYEYSGSSRSAGYHAEDVPQFGRPLQRGAVGLQNLGNTCFMNSSIQCLSNIPALRDFFVSGAYKSALNSEAFKTKGELAEAFASLMGHMWNPQVVQVAPRNFKWQIGQFAEQFAGYSQQDSMEFIEYALDGLKEDVNLVRGPKTFVEVKEADGRPDDLVAEEAKRSYRIRNNSFVDDLFLGFFKSTVSCPEPGCGRVSVTFDPYLSIKLGLSSQAENRVTKFDVVVVPRASSSSRPSGVHRVQVSVPKYGSAANIIEAAAHEAKIDAKDCVLSEIYSKKIHKWFEEKDAVSEIRSNDILALYELDSSGSGLWLNEVDRWGHNRGASSSAAFGPMSPDGSESPSDAKSGIVIMLCRSATSQCSSYTSRELIGLPLVTSMSKYTTKRELVETVTAELEKRVGACPPGTFTIHCTADKYSMDTRNRIEPTDEPLSLQGHQYLLVEWADDLEVPEVITKMQEEISGKSDYSTGADDCGAVPLEKCFKMFVQEDKLSRDDAWYCNRCKEHREAYKMLEFWTLPRVVVLQLKRFTYTQYSSRDRLNTAVIFPLDSLDLQDYERYSDDGMDPPVYDLAAMSKHIGGQGGGHYVAYARSSEDGRWYLFNDGHVSLVSAEDVQRENVGAYILFYLRRASRPAGWGPPR